MQKSYIYFILLLHLARSAVERDSIGFNLVPWRSVIELRLMQQLSAMVSTWDFDLTGRQAV